MARSQRHDDDLSTARGDVGSTDNGVDSVVTALHEHIRAQLANELKWSVLVEDRHGIDNLQGREHIRSLMIAAHGSRRPLEAVHGGIGVDADDEGVTVITGDPEDVDMTRVQKIEDAIGEDHASLDGRSPGNGLLEGEDLPAWIEPLPDHMPPL